MTQSELGPSPVPIQKEISAPHFRQASSRAGIQVISYQDHFEFDLAGHDGKLRLAMLAWVAEFERRRISERVKMGMRAAQVRGKPIGREALALNEEKVRAE